MKICFLSSMHPPDDKRVFAKEAVTLSRVGHEVTHLCPGVPSQTGEVGGVQIVTYDVPRGIQGRVLQLLKLYKLSKMIDADAYHCNEVDSWLVGVALKIIHKKRCIFDVHEHYPSTFAQSRFPRWFQPVVSGSVKLLYRALLPFTDRLVLAKQTVSEDFPCSCMKKVLVRNFALVSGLKFDNQAERGSAKSEVVLLHLGLFNKSRGWPQVLKAMTLMKYKNIKLVVIGKFDPDSREEFELEVDQLGLRPKLAIYDWLPFDEAYDHLLHAHIGLVTFQPGILNHVYAMPHKMFDYMAAGLAVVCPRFAVEVAPIVVDSGCGVLVDPSNPSNLAEKLDSLVSSPESIQQMGEKGREAVLKRYNWEAEAERLIQMYAELERTTKPATSVV